MQTANTLGKGKDRFSIEPGAQSYVQRDFATGVQDQGRIDVLPSLDVGYQRGVSDRIDLGVRLTGFSGLEFVSKFQVIDPGGVLVASIAPSIRGQFTYAGGETARVPLRTDVTLPLLLGLNVGESSQLVIGPRIVNSTFIGEAYFLPRDIVSAGTTVGFSFPVGERVRLMPEAGVLVPLLEFGAHPNFSVVGGRTLIFQAGLGISWGD